MTILNDNLLNALKSAKPKELRYVAGILGRSIKSGISIYEAAKIEKYQPGTKVTFSDRNGTEHIAIVEKVMTKRIRLFDKTAKAVVNIYPQLLKPYVPKVYASRDKDASVKVVNKANSGQDLASQAPRVKRKYVFKDARNAIAETRVKRKYVFKNTKPTVDLSPLLNKYGRKEAFNLSNPRQKRKYVRKIDSKATL